MIKLIKSVAYVLGLSGVGYILLQVCTPDESEMKKVIFSIYLGSKPRLKNHLNASISIIVLIGIFRWVCLPKWITSSYVSFLLQKFSHVDDQKNLYNFGAVIKQASEGIAPLYRKSKAEIDADLRALK